jgi:MoaA/NifB/PqqE/SkfB family radical SAM enzyme
MSHELAFSLIDEISGWPKIPRFLQLNGHGESTILPWFESFIDYAQTKLPTIDIGFQTNGSRLKMLAEFLVARGIHRINISVDGGDPLVFDRIRGDGAFERLIAGLEAINSAKARHGKERPELEFATLVTRQTVFEMTKLVALAKRFGVRRINAQSLTPYTDLGTSAWALSKLAPSEKVEADSLFRQAIALAKENFIEFNLLNADIWQEPRPQFHQRRIPQWPSFRRTYRACRDPWYTAFVNVHGRLNTCCIRPNDARERLADRSLREIWYHSVGLAGVRRQLQTGRLDSVCRQCTLRPRADEPPELPREWNESNAW